MTATDFTFRSRHAAASADHIRQVAATVSEAGVAAMLDIGATREELELAAAYARGEGDVVGRRHYALTWRVKRIFDIMTGDGAGSTFATGAGRQGQRA